MGCVPATRRATVVAVATAVAMGASRRDGCGAAVVSTPPVHAGEQIAMRRRPQRIQGSAMFGWPWPWKSCTLAVVRALVVRAVGLATLLPLLQGCTGGARPVVTRVPQPQATGPAQPTGTAATEAPVEPPRGDAGPAVTASGDEELAGQERSLREQLATASDPTGYALELAALLVDLERHQEALAMLVGVRQRLAAAGRAVDPVLQVAIAGVHRDLGQRHLAVAGLEALLADRGALGLHPGLVFEIAELQWLEGRADAAVATLAELRRGHADSAWLASQAGAVQRLEHDLANRAAPTRVRLRDLFGNLRGATEAFVRLRTLEELVRLADEPADATAGEPRVAAVGPMALAIAFGDADGLVRARAVQLTGPVEAPEEFCRAALADADARVRTAAVAKAVAWLGTGSRPLLLETLANESDPQAFRACHEALVDIVGNGPVLAAGAEAQARQRQAAVVAWRQW